MPRQVLTLVLFMLWIPAGWCANLDVYKWVDDDGSVHYDERERVPYAERITVKPISPPPSPSPQSATNSEQAARPGVTSSACRQARALLDSYRKAPFLYEEVEGKRKILSDEDRKRIESMAEKDVETACGSAP